MPYTVNDEPDQEFPEDDIPPAFLIPESKRIAEKIRNNKPLTPVEDRFRHYARHVINRILRGEDVRDA